MAEGRCKKEELGNCGPIKDGDDYCLFHKPGKSAEEAREFYEKLKEQAVIETDENGKEKLVFKGEVNCGRSGGSGIRQSKNWISILISIVALTITGLTLYFSFFYINQDLYIAFLRLDRLHTPPKYEESEVALSKNNDFQYLDTLHPTIAFINAGTEEVMVSRIIVRVTNNRNDSMHHIIDTLGRPDIFEPIIIPPNSVKQLTLDISDPIPIRAIFESIEEDDFMIDVNYVIALLSPSSGLEYYHVSWGRKMYVYEDYWPTNPDIQGIEKLR